MNAMPLLDLQEFDDLDRHFARFIARFGGGERVALAAACLSRAVRLSHICLDLAAAPSPAFDTPIPWPSLEEWRCELRASRAVVEPPGSGAGAKKMPPGPLVLDAAGRLYLRRYYEYEQALAAALRARAGRGAESGEGQEAAIEAAVAQRLTVISGGPGTGKTTTVMKILVRLMEGEPALRIALAAPTGKAAARLEEAVRSGFAERSRGDLAERLPRAKTLHRLLGSRPHSPSFRHHAENPLALDVLVVDEASMVPLPLMAKLFAALPERARVILLGDRDQLASVEPGSVLADIAEAAAAPASPLRGALVTLKKNYRFGNESGIFKLCEAVREGDTQAALEMVGDRTRSDLGSAALPVVERLPDALREPVLEGYGLYLAERDPGRALAAFSRFRILCALRRGPYGVEELNRQIEKVLREAGLIRGGQSRFHAGMPVLITRNDYQLNLFNGDIGILLPEPEPGLEQAGEHGFAEKPLWAWFPGETKTKPGGGGGGAALRRVSPARLPDHEPAYAMTVHKSQGSEFERVLLLLTDRDSPVLTRELIYTGLTRARSRVDLWFEKSAFEHGVACRTERASGLRDALAAPI